MGIGREVKSSTNILLGGGVIFINMFKYFCIKVCKMSSKSVTLKVDSRNYNNYRQYCKKKFNSVPPV